MEPARWRASIHMALAMSPEFVRRREEVSGVWAENEVEANGHRSGEIGDFKERSSLTPIVNGGETINACTASARNNKKIRHSLSEWPVALSEK